MGYAQSNALKGKTFASLQEQNVHLLDWETRVADTRIHGTTRKQIAKVFAEVERPALLPLSSPFVADGIQPSAFGFGSGSAGFA